MFGLPQIANSGMSFHRVYKHFYRHIREVNLLLFGIVSAIIIVFHLLVVKKPKFAWHTIFLLLALLTGIVFRPMFYRHEQNKKDMSILNSNWPERRDIDMVIKNKP